MEQRIRRMNDAITPFTLAVPQAGLEDLNRRIDQTGASRRRQHISSRDQSPLAALGRSVDAKPDPLQHPGPGGHFAAWEQPALHTKEIRDCFAKVR
jgi:hypothetical protein